MIITDLQITEASNHCELSAEIIPETAGLESHRIWYRFPPEYHQFIAKSGEPFLALALPAAMVLREPIRIEAPVSPQLLRSLSQIQSIYRQWIRGAQRIEIFANPLVQKGVGGSATGCFFSAGVDSWHALLKNEKQITHLILLRGYDRGLRDEATFGRTVLLAQKVAATYSKKLLVIESNFRKFSDRHVEWIMQFGASLASAGLTMPGLFKRLIIPASEPYHMLHPVGSDPLLDPLWSTEQITFDHNGCEASRLEKVKDWICHSELALQTLRVCWKHKENEYNCGKCEKCLRTMLELYIGARLADASTFTVPLRPESIRRLKLNRYSDLHFAMESLTALAESSKPFDRKLCKALRHAIRMGRFRLAKRFWHKDSLYK